jgi:hypothetical protein
VQLTDRRSLLVLSHLCGEFPNLGEIPLHFTPAIAERVIRTGVERPLKRPHAVFKVLGLLSFQSETMVGAFWL